MTPARFRWGMILILIGVLILLRNLDIFDTYFWPDLLVFLPVVLIAIGIEKIFTNSKGQAIAYLTTVALVGGAFWVVFNASDESGIGSYFESSYFSEAYDPEVNLVNARLHLNQNDVTVRDATDQLFEGEFDRFTSKPEISLARSGNTVDLELTSKRKSRFFGGIVKVETDEPQEWYLSFSEDIPLVLAAEGDESVMHLNFSTTPLKGLKIEAADSDLYIKLGELMPHVQMLIDGVDSRMRLLIPQTAGLRVRSGFDYSDYLQEIGLRNGDSVYQSEGFDSLSPQIELELNSELEHLSVEFF
jgi:energy-converting hydrogenase Eha subunit A